MIRCTHHIIGQFNFQYRDDENGELTFSIALTRIRSAIILVRANISLRLLSRSLTGGACLMATDNVMLEHIHPQDPLTERMVVLTTPYSRNHLYQLWASRSLRVLSGDLILSLL